MANKASRQALKRRRAERRIIREERHRKRVPTQPEGMPQGKHSTRKEDRCMCGGCHPNAKAAKGRVVVI